MDDVLSPFSSLLFECSYALMDGTAVSAQIYEQKIYNTLPEEFSHIRSLKKDLLPVHFVVDDSGETFALRQSSLFSLFDILLRAFPSSLFFLQAYFSTLYASLFLKYTNDKESLSMFRCMLTASLD